MLSTPGRYRRPLLLSLLGASVLYVLLVLAGDYQAILERLGRFGWSDWGLILGLSLVNYLLRFYRWQGYLALLGHSPPLGRHLACYLAGFALTTTPGKAGELIRAWYLKAQGVDVSHSLAAFVTERFLDLGAMLLLALLAAAEFPGHGWLLGLVAALLLGMLPLLHSRALARGLHAWGEGNGRLAVPIRHLARLLETSRVLLEPRPGYTGLALGLLAWGAEGLALWLILDGLGLSVAPLLAVGIYAISVLVGALSFIPGGLGGTEAVMGLLLIAAGADPATAVAATLICRLATLWFAVALGMMAMAGLEWPGTAPHGHRLPGDRS